jgi:hypothetical protein
VRGLKPPGYQAPFSCGSGGVNVHRPAAAAAAVDGWPPAAAAAGGGAARPAPRVRVRVGVRRRRVGGAKLTRLKKQRLEKPGHHLYSLYSFQGL